MASTDWYTLARNTHYPLIATPTTGVIGSLILDKSVLIDAGIVLGPGSINPSTPATEVWLYKIVKTGSQIKFHFVSKADVDVETPVWEFVFTRTTSDAFGLTEYVEATSVASHVSDLNHGFGFLVTGDLSYFVGKADGTYAQGFSTRNNTRLEPALVQTLYGNTVNKIHIANDEGAKCVSCDDCMSSSSTPCPPAIPAEDLPCNKNSFVIATDFSGDVRLQPGYNAVIDTSVANNTITISALLDAGEGRLREPCEGIDRAEPYVYDSSSSSLVPNPACPYEYPCYEVISTINGIPPDDSGNFRIIGGPGITISTSDGKIVISGDYKSVMQECN